MKIQYMATFETPVNENCKIDEAVLWRDTKRTFVPPVGTVIQFDEYRHSFIVQGLDYNENKDILTIILDSMRCKSFEDMDMQTERLITKFGWNA